MFILIFNFEASVRPALLKNQEAEDILVAAIVIDFNSDKTDFADSDICPISFLHTDDVGNIEELIENMVIAEESEEIRELYGDDDPDNTLQRTLQCTEYVGRRKVF